MNQQAETTTPTDTYRKALSIVAQSFLCHPTWSSQTHADYLHSEHGIDPQTPLTRRNLQGKTEQHPLLTYIENWLDRPTLLCQAAGVQIPVRTEGERDFIERCLSKSNRYPGRERDKYIRNVRGTGAWLGTTESGAWDTGVSL